MADAISMALTVEQLAAVHAADQDELPTADVFAQHGITDESWRHERPKLLGEIASSASMFKTYTRALEAAQDELYRPIAPLYDDAAAWLAYNDAINAGPTSFVLKRHGLTVGDVARLDRHWRKRFAAEPALAKAARKAAAETGELPPIAIGPRRGRDDAARLPAEPEPSEAPPATPDAYEVIERAAVVSVLLARDEPAASLARRGIASKDEAADIVARAEALADTDPAMMNLFRRRQEHARALFERRTEAPPPAARLELDATAPPFDISEAIPPSSVVQEIPRHRAVGATVKMTTADLGLDAVPFAAQARTSPNVTVIGSQGSPVQAPLPFDGTSPPPPLAPTEAHGAVGLTGAFDIDVFGASELPFEDSDDIRENVRRYASYFVCLLLYPGARDEIMHRYNVSEDQHAALVASWDQRILHSRQIAAEYHNAIRIYSEWLHEHGPKT